MGPVLDDCEYRIILLHHLLPPLHDLTPACRKLMGLAIIRQPFHLGTVLGDGELATVGLLPG